MIVLTICTEYNNGKIDVSVKPEQRIRDVLDILNDSSALTLEVPPEGISVRSWRQKTYVNPYLTFKQAGIRHGDRLTVM